VIAWVNGTDPAFAQRFAEATNTTAECDRVENSNEHILSLTAICKHQRWVHQVFVVVDQQTFSLDFLPPGCPKVSILDMSEFVPSQYLPTFNSHVFETFLWRIPGLSEHFIYLNDDMVLAHPIQPAKLFQLPDGDAAAGSEPAVTAASGPQPDSNGSTALLRANLKQRDWKVPHPEAEVPLSAIWIWPRWNGLELFQSAFDGARPAGFDAHGAYFLTKSAMQKTWDMFGPQLERALTQNKKRHYARLADGGDVHFTSLSQQVGVQLGLMATDSPITTLVVHNSDPSLSHYVQSLFNSKAHVVCLQEMRRVSDQDLAKLCGLVADVWCATVPLTTHQRVTGDPCKRLVAMCSQRVHCDRRSGRRRLQLRR
jgi:hypothetical protein